MSTSEINKVVCSITNYIVERKRFEKSFASHIFKNYKKFFFKSTGNNNPLYGELHIFLTITDIEVRIPTPNSDDTRGISHKLDTESIIEILTSCGGDINDTHDRIAFSLKPYNEFSHSPLSDQEYSSPSTIKNMLIAIAKAHKTELEEEFTTQFADFLSKNWRECFSTDHVRLFLRETENGTHIESKIFCDSTPYFVSKLPAECIVAILKQTDNITCHHCCKYETSYDVDHYQVIYSL